MEKIRLMLESYLKAPGIIKKLKLSWGYLIGGVVGIIILIFFYWLSDYIGDWIFNRINIIFDVKSYAGLFRWLIIFIIRTIMIAIEYFFFKTILLGILAPFFSYISEKIENYQEGTEYKFTLKENLNFILRGIKIASKSFVKEIIYTFIVILLGFIPVVNLIVPILIFLI
ncbi:MAG: EI24 domain-containing protein, partial [Cetobacterium sp.]